ncbi:MAG: signal peptidase I [Eubacteriales bacterium]
MMEREDLQLDEDIPSMLQTTQGKISKLESDCFYLLQSLMFTLSFVIVLFTFVCPITKVSGESMEPTLHDGQTLLVWIFFGYTPAIHDIVIITDPTVEEFGGSSIVKRVIALEGQTVEIDYVDHQVRVDGIPIYEPYILEQMRPIYGDLDQGVLTVPEGCIFVLGDNRNHSSDSRSPSIGMVNVGYVKGKVLLSLWPFEFF